MHTDQANGPESERDAPLRLHLGCGAMYLEGYVNVDYPESETVQTRNQQPDVECDIRTPSYDPATVDEVRNHHVLEHFDKIEALRLLVEWTSWLKLGGILFVETPDFESAARRFLGSSDPEERLKFVRHLYGSNEAGWARHLDAWWEGKFRLTLGRLGYEIIEVSRPDYGYWNNVSVRAVKREAMQREQLLEAAEEILAMSAVLPDEAVLRDEWRVQLRTAAEVDAVPGEGESS